MLWHIRWLDRDIRNKLPTVSCQNMAIYDNNNEDNDDTDAGDDSKKFLLQAKDL